jgi:hypothetical protein
MSRAQHVFHRSGLLVVLVLLISFLHPAAASAAPACPAIMFSECAA